MSLNLTYDPRLSRVRADPAGLTGASVRLERQQAGGVRFDTVRGAAAVPLEGGATLRPIDDYEFHPDTTNLYRLTEYDQAGAQLSQETATITPMIGAEPWVKVISRPYLNRPVVVQDYGEVKRADRAGVYDVIGRSFPVAVSDVRGSRRFALVILTEGDAEAFAVDMIAASGDPIYLQVPAGANLEDGGYFHVGTITKRRPARQSTRRLYTFELTEIAAPAPDVAGGVGTWNTVTNGYPTWADLLAEPFTWDDVLELVGSPGDVIVP